MGIEKGRFCRFWGLGIRRHILFRFILQDYASDSAPISSHDMFTTPQHVADNCDSEAPKISKTGFAQIWVWGCLGGHRKNYELLSAFRNVVGPSGAA